MELSVVILAAGQGTRMKSALPKVLHPLADKPLVEHVVDTARLLGAADIHVVYGHGGDIVPQTLSHLDVSWIRQDQQLGTGHAVAQAMPEIPAGHQVLVLYGDVPLTALTTLQQLIGKAGNDGMALLTVCLDDPTGYGRIVRDASGAVTSIVEHKDASDAQKSIQEVNTGILVAPQAKLAQWLAALDNNNAQGEFYLTDVIAMAVAAGMTVETAAPAETFEVLGVNNKRQLAELERDFQRIWANRLMDAGVTLRDPARIDVRGSLEVGRDVVIDVNAVFEGEVVLGDDVTIGPNCYIKDARIGNGVAVAANTVIEDAVVGDGSKIGPFARLRPGADLAQETHIGNFVEIKKATIGRGSKVNHLSYVGDAVVGASVNIGAGTITCNYDGVNKHVTEIGDNVFVGSDTQFIAPVKVGDGATIGAGSTITRDVPAEKLTLSRAKQVSIDGWARPTKNKNKE